MWFVQSYDDVKRQWGVKAEENVKTTRYFNTKEEAEAYAKQLVTKNEDARVVLHKKDGKFQKAH